MHTNNIVSRRRLGASDAAEVKQRRRLENLLYTRRRLIQLAAEYRSHGLEDHFELYTHQLQVEQVLADEFPAAFDAVVGDWAVEDAETLHHPWSRESSCSLCRAITAHEATPNGGFTAPPQAA
ncbi:hypothetical protein L615_001200000050 [Nocardioides sp. J9]|uniref:hypothetical protein n=1 Tax=Nocardioides sp. J9 TaxID=935844 RepID=UPI0011A32B2C|nr:hypothetical protein [Nocardioides sp. J9]TWH03136.1 hypothetical protein L615_001200000050 [Nocardioides sp. J9]